MLTVRINTRTTDTALRMSEWKPTYQKLLELRSMRKFIAILYFAMCCDCTGAALTLVPCHTVTTATGALFPDPTTGTRGPLCSRQVKPCQGAKISDED